MDIREAIKKVTVFEDLTEDETRDVFDQIMGGEATPAQIGAFLIGLRMKGETIEEITGAARVIREKALKVETGCDDLIVDTCGTGGTGKDTFNISTTVAFVVAGCGVRVAKHGNRAASGRCGSADVLEALGVGIDVPAEVSKECLERIGIAFLFAPGFHKAMKYAVGPRKELGVRTVFNVLGPISNPAGAACQVVGVYDEALTEKIAQVLRNLGAGHSFVVHGMEGFDELALSGKTKVSELVEGSVKTYYVEPADFGMKEISGPDIKGGTAEENARTIRSVLHGEKGPRADIVLMNASVVLVAAGKASDFKEGVEIARVSIESGKAEEKLEKLIRMTSKGQGA